ncbi:MAG: hypothetical protein LBH43_14985 [Treponema sp.]|nr:hypothetical protein [Treponema sp.]
MKEKTIAVIANPDKSCNQKKKLPSHICEQIKANKSDFDKAEKGGKGKYGGLFY